MILAPVGNRQSPWGIGSIKDDGSYRVISSDPHKSMSPGRYDLWFRRVGTPNPEAETTVKDSNPQIPKKYLDPDNPNPSIELKQIPSEVDITLRD